MRKVVISLFLLSLLVSVPLTASAKVALFENFSTGTLGSRWSTYSHGGVTAEVVDFEGNKVLKMAGSGVVAAGDTTWTDYTVEGDMYIFDASYGAYAAGVLYRGIGEYSNIRGTEAYVYQGRPGVIELEKWSFGEVQYPSDDYSHSITPGTWHHIKIVCQGQHFQHYVDNVLALDYTDPNAYKAGQVGFRTWGAGAYFDNLMVTTKEDLPPGVVLSEDFSEGVLDPRWSTYDHGGFSYEIVKFEGKNVLKLNNSGIVAIGDPSWTDYTAEADVYVNDPWYWAYAAGLMFRVQGPLSGWSENMNAYVMEGRPNFVELEKWTRASWWQDLSENYSPPFTSNAWHHFKAVCVGPRIRLYMDDVLMSDYSDAQPHLFGQVGLRAYAVGAYYGNLKVTLNDIIPPATTSTIAGTAGTAGWYTSDATVTLTASDAQSGVREIHYSIDGGQEVVVAADTASVTLSTQGVHTLTYYAIDAAMDANAETSKTLQVSIDKSVPTAVATPTGTAGTNGWFRSAVSVALSAADAASGVKEIRYSVNGGTAVAVSGASATVSLPVNKVSTISYSAVDNAGNQSTAETQTVSSDAVVPTVTVSVSTKTITANNKLQAVKISGSASDALSGIASTSITVTDNKGVVVATAPAFGSTVQLKGVKGQVYTITATSADKAGNAATARATVTVK